MKVKASIKKRSEDCKIVKRKGKLYVICKKNPKFKTKNNARTRKGRKKTVANKKKATK